MPTLTQRIKERSEQRDPPKVTSLRPTPIWRRRIESNRAKDMTAFFIDGSWTPDGDGGAA